MSNRDLWYNSTHNEVLMRKIILLGCLFVLGGCGVLVPSKLKVTDVSSGKTFTTYATWGKENMLGYNFYDIATGQRVMLKSYTTSVIDNGGYFPPESKEATAYQSSLSRVSAASGGQ